MTTTGWKSIAATAVLGLTACGHKQETAPQAQAQMKDWPNPTPDQADQAEQAAAEQPGDMQAYGVQTDLQRTTAGPEMAAQGPEAGARDPSVSGARAQMEAQGQPVGTGKGLALAPEIARACPEAESNMAFFAADSAALGEGERQQLELLVACLQRENMQDRRLEIVGYADPRGSEQYNMQLGRRRAEAIADMFVGAGIERDRIELVSEGEQGAGGRGRPWAYHRRAEVRFAD